MADYILTLEHEVKDCRYCPCVRFSHPTDDEEHGDCVCSAYHDDFNGSNVVEKDVSWVDMLDCKGSKIIEKPSWCPLVALPEHGRLISDTDVKALLRSGLSLDTDSDIDHVCGLIDGLPTIVEATE